MGYNILIVDDSSPMRMIIKKNIKASGFKTGNLFEAANGMEALEIIKTEWLDIILTDYNMPVMNGLELVSEIKKIDAAKDIPIVMISTEGSKERINAFFESGITGYIKKPFTPQVIKAKLNELLGETEYEEETDDSDDGFDF